MAAEVNPVELLGLPGRESWCVERLYDLICELPLLRRKHRRVAVPVQAGANVRVDPRTLTRHLVRESVQVPDLIEQRLKLFVGNRHEATGTTSSRQVLPLVLTRGSTRMSECFRPLV